MVSLYVNVVFQFFFFSFTSKVMWIPEIAWWTDLYEETAIEAGGRAMRLPASSCRVNGYMQSTDLLGRSSASSGARVAAPRWPPKPRLGRVGGGWIPLRWPPRWQLPRRRRKEGSGASGTATSSRAGRRTPFCIAARWRGR